MPKSKPKKKVKRPKSDRKFPPPKGGKTDFIRPDSNSVLATEEVD